VIVLLDGQILGGDTHFYYTGSYTFKNGKWRGELITHQHAEALGVTLVFGGREIACGFNRPAQAIAATFARRKTEIPTERPDGLTLAFASDPTKQQQWAAFVQEVAVNPGSLADVVEALASFLLPHAEKAANLHAKR
jgi:hypothetical protein